MEWGRKIALHKKILLKKNEIIKIGKYKYVVYKFAKKSVELIPIDEMLSGITSQFVPKMKIEKQSLNSYEKMDNYELLWLVNQSHPLIKEVLEDFLNKESKKR